MDGVRLHPLPLADRQALFEQGACRLQLTLLQVNESQQTERIDAEGGVAPFPKVGQALLSPLLGARLVLLRDKEQARQHTTSYKSWYAGVPALCLAAGTPAGSAPRQGAAYHPTPGRAAGSPPAGHGP